MHVNPSSHPPWLVVQDGSPWRSAGTPHAILVARSLEEVRPVLRAAEAARASGRWIAGFVAYEAAPAFDAALVTHPPAPGLPLAWFAVLDAFPESAAPPPATPPPPALAPTWSESAHAAAIRDVKEAIARGETYQVNVTFPLAGPLPAASPWDLFCAMQQAQRGGFAAFIDTPSFAICSASPELFFRRTAGGRLSAQPMKGTAARGLSWQEDERAGAALRASAKDRAENVMIVDMLRNDLGRVARTGTVRTTSLFDVHRLPTLWQMTSTIEAESEAGIDALFAALFPCASITGAPKASTMARIRALESGPRGLYTGTIGFAAPDGRMQFNVAIRTLVLDRPNATATYGVGSGVVWDSDPASEYRECLAKAAVLTPADDDFDLFTTLRWSPAEGFVLLDRHLTRLARAAAYFCRPFVEHTVRNLLQHAVHAFPREPRRVRVIVQRDGTALVTDTPLPATPAPVRLAVARQPVPARDPWLHFKNTRRARYDAALAEAPDADDVVLWNARGEATETCRMNLAAQINGQWITPPETCGLLPGVLREELLATGQLTEAILTVDDLRRAPALAVFNALRGWNPAKMAI